ncbi:MAG: DUF47 domain-containing protein [Candidatus Hydrogenedens sp.]
MFHKAQNWVEKKINEYCQKSQECVDLGMKVLTGCIDVDDCDKWKETTSAVHRAESKADDLRREIEYFIFERSLFPESRGDILALLEILDRIPNQVQQTVKMIVEQQIHIPKMIKNEVISISTITQKCVKITVQGVEMLFSDFREVLEILGQIDALESEVDKIQSDAITKVFQSDIEPFRKLLLRDLINSISEVTNHAEKAGDFMRIIIVKRMM